MAITTIGGKSKAAGGDVKLPDDILCQTLTAKKSAKCGSLSADSAKMGALDVADGVTAMAVISSQYSEFSGDIFLNGCTYLNGGCNVSDNGLRFVSGFESEYTIKPTGIDFRQDKQHTAIEFDYCDIDCSAHAVQCRSVRCGGIECTNLEIDQLSTAGNSGLLFSTDGGSTVIISYYDADGYFNVGGNGLKATRFKGDIQANHIDCSDSSGFINATTIACQVLSVTDSIDVPQINIDYGTFVQVRSNTTRTDYLACDSGYVAGGFEIQELALTGEPRIYLNSERTRWIEIGDDDTITVRRSSTSYNSTTSGS